MYNTDDVYVSRDRRAPGKRVRLDSPGVKNNNKGWLATTIFHPTDKKAEGIQRFISQDTLNRFYSKAAVVIPQDAKFAVNTQVWISTQQVAGVVHHYLRDLHSDKLRYFVASHTDKVSDWIATEEELSLYENHS